MVIQNSPVIVHSQHLVVAQCRPTSMECPDAFAVIRDRGELTIIAERSLLPGDVLAIEDGFRLFEFIVAEPFGAPGFISAIAAALAARGINIFPMSTFSRDYVLIRDEDCPAAITALVERGFPNPQLEI